ncbi:hypothetical protein EON66_03475 [archaeon]|nr:MAG: hypothetical protein EON66_03475 [archaeon]
MLVSAWALANDTAADLHPMNMRYLFLMEATSADLPGTFTRAMRILCTHPIGEALLHACHMCAVCVCARLSRACRWDRPSSGELACGNEQLLPFNALV